MPMDNSLNLSEMLKRLGVVGDSLASAPLLDQMRMSMKVADLSGLVPPVSGPRGAASIEFTAGVGSRIKWNLHCRSAGGLIVQMVLADPSQSRGYDFWITPTNPFGALTSVANEEFAFGQVAQSVFSHANISGAKIAPITAIRFESEKVENIAGQVWLGPGLFLNIESVGQNTTDKISIIWTEFPAMINP